MGAFHVTGLLTATSCGPTPSPWEFDVKLRHDGQSLYWVQGDAPASGTVDLTSHVVIASSDTRTLRDGDEKQKLAACVVTRTDSLTVELTDGATAVSNVGSTKALRGTLTYRFAPTPASMCDDQLLSTGGDYQALPCEVHYTITAFRMGDLPK